MEVCGRMWTGHLCGLPKGHLGVHECTSLGVPHAQFIDVDGYWRRDARDADPGMFFHWYAWIKCDKDGWPLDPDSVESIEGSREHLWSRP